jgi:lipoprotein signal peptidase
MSFNLLEFVWKIRTWPFFNIALMLICIGRAVSASHGDLRLLDAAKPDAR